MDQKCTNDTRFLYNNELDENLAWLIQNIQKVIKGILLSPHTVNVIELQSNKKSDNGPPLLQQPPFSGLSPPFKQNILYPPPQVTQFLGLETLGDKLIFLVVEGESTSLLR